MNILRLKNIVANTSTVIAPNVGRVYTTIILAHTKKLFLSVCDCDCDVSYLSSCWLVVWFFNEPNILLCSFYYAYWPISFTAVTNVTEMIFITHLEFG